MKYKEIEIANQLNDSVQKHIIIDNEDGSFKSFPADENNPEYIAFLAQLEQSETPEDTL
jgi:hypothetical protein